MAKRAAPEVNAGSMADIAFLLLILRQAAIEFLDNGGGTNAAGERCDYCKGKRDESSSDHPDKAIISMKHDRETSYEKYIDVQNELVAAYNFLREREAKRLFGNLKEYRGTEKVYQAMLEEKEKNQFSKDTILNGRIEAVKKLFPMKLSEAEPDKS